MLNRLWSLLWFYSSREQNKYEHTAWERVTFFFLLLPSPLYRLNDLYKSRQWMQIHLLGDFHKTYEQRNINYFSNGFEYNKLNCFSSGPMVFDLRWLTNTVRHSQWSVSLAWSVFTKSCIS